MTTSQRQPNTTELYPLEAWALRRISEGYTVSPDVEVRPDVYKMLAELQKEEPKWREPMLRRLVGNELATRIYRLDPESPQPKGRGQVPPKKMLVDDAVPETDAKHRVKPTDDELGEELIAKWEGDSAFIYGEWHKYREGVWLPAKRNGLEFWQVLIDNKERGIKPNSGKASSVEGYCQLKLMVEEEQTNQNLEYINVKNGLFNLKTARLEPHRRELYMTSQLPFAYDPAALCPTWDKFLDDVLVTPEGKPDYELANLLQEAFGYSLTAYTHLRASFWTVGPSGSGKSTLLKVLTNLAGTGHIAIDLDQMKESSYQLADVAGKRVVTFTEPDARSPLADGQYKRLVSSDVVSARQIHGRPFNFVPQCKLWGAMNDTPRVVDRSDAVYGRIIIFPMLNAIPKDKWDLQIDEKLRNELPGIFNWALVGLARVLKIGAFSKAAQSEQARNDYKSENDAEATYVDERLDKGDRFMLKANELYNDYKAWCESNGFKPKNRNSVSKDWKRLGMVAKKLTDANYYANVRLKSETAGTYPF